jgi:hypothetical protein
MPMHSLTGGEIDAKVIEHFRGYMAMQPRILNVILLHQGGIIDSMDSLGSVLSYTFKFNFALSRHRSAKREDRSISAALRSSGSQKVPS